MKSISAIGLFLLFGCTVFAQTDKVVDWKSDIAFLKSELPSKHKNLFFKLSKQDFETRLDGLSSKSSDVSSLGMAVQLQQLIAQVGDSHTEISFDNLFDNSRMLPLQVYWFSDGLYVLKTTKGNEKLLGTRITKMNGFDIQVVVDSLSTLITIDNKAMLKARIPNMIYTLQLLEYFGFSKQDAWKLEVQDLQGQSFEQLIKPEKIDKYNVVSFKPDSVALCWQNQRAFFYDQYFENDSIYFLQYNKCWSKEVEAMYGNKEKAEQMPSMLDFENQVFNTLRTKAVNKLIFDMRFNSGGNSIQGTAFIAKLAKLDLAQQDKKLYVAIGRKTFSSAIINTIDFKQKTKALLVGEETAGKPNHFGEVKRFQLPSSGITINYSTKYFQRVDENPNTIKPDILLETSFLDFKKGIDPVFEWIKKQ